jgi:hypothetical protein
MKFVLFVEGETEYKILSPFLKRWLDPKLNAPVGIQIVLFQGWSELVNDAPKIAHKFLDQRKKQDDIIAVISLLDLYGPDKSNFYPSHLQTVAERHNWAKVELEKRVSRTEFRQFFAVHELEAWLLSDPTILPAKIPGKVKEALRGKVKHPEVVDFDEHPEQLLNQLYNKHLQRRYLKSVDGVELFKKLNPSIAYDKCPYLKTMLDEMLSLAQAAGL